MLIDADSCSNKFQMGFLLSDPTSGASSVIFKSGLTRLVKCDQVSLKLAIILVLVLGYERFAQPASLRLRISQYID